MFSQEPPIVSSAVFVVELTRSRFNSPFVGNEAVTITGGNSIST